MCAGRIKLNCLHAEARELQNSSQKVDLTDCCGSETWKWRTAVANSQSTPIPLFFIPPVHVALRLGSTIVQVDWTNYKLAMTWNGSISKKCGQIRQKQQPQTRQKEKAADYPQIPQLDLRFVFGSKSNQQKNGPGSTQNKTTDLPSDTDGIFNRITKTCNKKQR